MRFSGLFFAFLFFSSALCSELRYVLHYQSAVPIAQDNVESFWINKLSLEGFKARLVARADELGCGLSFTDHPLLGDPIALSSPERNAQENLLRFLLEAEFVKEKGLTFRESLEVKQLYINWLARKQEELDWGSEAAERIVLDLMRDHFPTNSPDEFVRKSLHFLQEMDTLVLEEWVGFVFSASPYKVYVSDEKEMDALDVTLTQLSEAMDSWHIEKAKGVLPKEGAKMILCKEYVNEIGEVIIIPDEEDGLQNVDPFKTLVLHESEKKILYKLISDMAEKSWATLANKSKELESMGAQVKHVHPLKSVAYLFSDPYLKECMKKIYQSSVPFKWSKFVKDYSDSMRVQASRNNLIKHIPGFAEKVGKDPDLILEYITAKDYEGFLIYLM